MWTHPFKHLVSAKDKLICFQFLHRSYFTPPRLAKIFPSVSAEWWRCSHLPADADHIFWKCTLIQDQRFWSAFTLCISELLVIPMTTTIRVCLLGLFEDVVPSRALRTLLNILFFYGMKAILLKWKKQEASDLVF